MQGLIGLVALAGGAALLAHILAGVSLVLGVAAAAFLLAGVALAIGRIASPELRRLAARTAAAAAAAGLIATLAYDAARTGLSLLDSSAYDPYEAVRTFGTLLAGPAAPAAAILAAGMAYHLVNGVSFGVAYGFLFGRSGEATVRWALLTGIGWGLFLEGFQLALYPGWLDIRAVREFAQISAASHLVYGATLGVTCRWLLRRIDPQGART